MDITFTLNQAGIDSLDKSRLHLELPDRAATLKRALALLIVAVEADKAGGELIIQKGNEESRVLLT